MPTSSEGVGLQVVGSQQECICLSRSPDWRYCFASVFLRQHSVKREWWHLKDSDGFFAFRNWGVGRPVPWIT